MKLTEGQWLGLLMVLKDRKAHNTKALQEIGQHYPELDRSNAVRGVARQNEWIQELVTKFETDPDFQEFHGVVPA